MSWNYFNFTTDLQHHQLFSIVHCLDCDNQTLCRLWIIISETIRYWNIKWTIFYNHSRQARGLYHPRDPGPTHILNSPRVNMKMVSQNRMIAWHCLTAQDQVSSQLLEKEHSYFIMCLLRAAAGGRWTETLSQALQSHIELKMDVEPDCSTPVLEIWYDDIHFISNTSSVSSSIQAI